jgi:hypothetical protein
MEEWPEVSGVSDASVWFQYEAREAEFSLPLADLHRNAEIVHPPQAIKAPHMKIRTSALIPTTRERLWPWLTSSRMDVPGRFCMGVPSPVSCELPESVGRVGAERRCISDRGTVVQRITVWQPPMRLEFRMVSTDHGWARCVDSIEENFQLEQIGHKTRITRTTRLRARGRWKLLKEAMFYLGLKRVHYFVFKNWRKQAGRAD